MNPTKMFPFGKLDQEEIRNAFADMERNYGQKTLWVDGGKIYAIFTANGKMCRLVTSKDVLTVADVRLLNFVLDGNSRRPAHERFMLALVLDENIPEMERWLEPVHVEKLFTRDPEEWLQ